MSRSPVAELVVQRQARISAPHPTALATTREHARDGGDLRAWVDNSALPPAGFVFGGLGLAAAGFVAAALLMPGLGLMGVAAVSGMITLGGGLTFLGVLKGKGRADATPALPAAPLTSPDVLVERARRIRHVLADGEATFEALLARLRWTEAALLETLVHMKDHGVLEEDLNLDSGEWVYRVQMSNTTGVAASMMLEERRARSGAEHG